MITPPARPPASGSPTRSARNGARIAQGRLLRRDLEAERQGLGGAAAGGVRPSARRRSLVRLRSGIRSTLGGSAALIDSSVIAAAYRVLTLGDGTGPIYVGVIKPRTSSARSRAGLYCPPGDFYIDPVRPVARAVITHGQPPTTPGLATTTVAATPETLAIMAVRYGEGFAGNLRSAMAYDGETLGARRRRGDRWSPPATCFGSAPGG